MNNFSENAPEILQKVDTKSDDFVKNLCYYLFKDLDNEKDLLVSVIKALQDRCEKALEPKSAH